MRLKNLKKDIYILIINDCSKEKFKKTKNFKNFKKIIVLNLKKNLGSQKAIYVGLKYLQKKIKDYNNVIISILDSDGEDDPRALKKLIQITERKKDFFIFASRKGRTENRFYSSYIIIFTFLLLNILLFLISWFGKPKKGVSNFIKNIASIKIAS